MRFNLESGKVNEFAIEGLDSRTPKGPVKVARFALKSLDVANLMRMSALFANPAQQPPPDQALGMLPLIEGVEVKGLVAPYKNTGKPISIDTFDLNWGQFIGPIPSKARLIGLDLGSKTIGLAISDVERRLASPLQTLSRRAFQGIDCALRVPERRSCRVPDGRKVRSSAEGSGHVLRDFRETKLLFGDSGPGS